MVKFSELEMPEQASDYLNKFSVGEPTKLRILSDAIIGWQAYKDIIRDDGTPGKTVMRWQALPNPNECFEKGVDPEELKSFVAFVIYNYNEEKIQVWNLDKKTIFNQLKAYIENDEYGDPTGYNITISRTGTTQNDTKYSLIASPPSKLDESVEELYRGRNINLEALFDNGDPFEAEKKSAKESVEKIRNTVSGGTAFDDVVEESKPF